MSETIRAIFEDGVFRPGDRVELPEHTVVEFELGPVGVGSRRGTAKAAIHEILSRRYDDGDPEISSRHDEHQP